MRGPTNLLTYLLLLSFRTSVPPCSHQNTAHPTPISSESAGEGRETELELDGEAEAEAAVNRRVTVVEAARALDVEKVRALLRSHNSSTLYMMISTPRELQIAECAVETGANVTIVLPASRPIYDAALLQKFPPMRTFRLSAKQRKARQVAALRAKQRASGIMTSKLQIMEVAATKKMETEEEKSEVASGSSSARSRLAIDMNDVAAQPRSSLASLASPTLSAWDSREATTWTTRFEAICQQAKEVYIANDMGLSCSATNVDYCREVMIGIASVEARSIGTKLRRVLLLPPAEDGPLLPPAEDGPSYSRYPPCVQRWNSAKSSIDYETVRLETKLWRKASLADIASEATPTTTDPQTMHFRREKERDGEAVSYARCLSALPPVQIVAPMVFADVVGYSKLQDDVISQFVQHFLGAAADLLRDSVKHDPDSVPLVKNTWGDAFFFVFGSLAGAARFSLRLRDVVLASDWKACGMAEVRQCCFL